MTPLARSRSLAQDAEEPATLRVGAPRIVSGLESCPGIPRRVHLLGAGGAGVSGAARILVEHGHQVSGHDRSESEHVELLRALDVAVAIGDEGARLPEDVELLVRSAAVPASDPRVVEAQERGVLVLKYSELLGRVTPPGRTLAIAGTHGKTTTTWMVHHALRGLALAPGVARPAPGALVGGICRALGTNALAAEPGGWFAAEACEYDRSFHQLAPAGAIVTNVEADHLDYYGTLDAIKIAFARFADRVHPSGLLVLGAQTPRRVEEAARCAVWRLGRELAVDLLGENAGRWTFRLRGPEWFVPRVALAVPGRFNVDNAALALGLAVGLAAREWNLDPQEAAQLAARGLEGYLGSKRRFEPWGRVDGIDVVHDYAHHPTEVRVTLECARRAFPDKPLHVLFQPHQHSRTARFLDEFVESLRSADRVVVADVYGARTHIDGEHAAGAPELASKLALAGVEARAGGGLESSVREFVEGIPDHAAALVLGAGDVDQVKDELLEQLALRSAAARRPRG